MKKIILFICLISSVSLFAQKEEYFTKDLWKRTPATTADNSIMNKGDAAVTVFSGTVSSSGTTVTFSSAADAILAGYSATDPMLGTTIIAGGQTRYISSWSNATTAVVSSAPSPAWSTTAITSTQFPIALTKKSDGTVAEVTLANGDKGIGTTGLGQKLSVAGNIQLTTGGSIYGGTTNQRLWLSSISGSGLYYNSTHYISMGSGPIHLYSDSEIMTVGYNGNVGIGTVRPEKSLDVNSATGAGIRIIYNDADGSPAYWSSWSVNSTGDGTINSSGDTLNVTDVLVTDDDVSVGGNLLVQSDSTSHDIFVGNATYSYMDAGAGWTTSSDINLKEDIIALSNVVDKSTIAQKILNTPLYRYSFKKESLGWKDIAALPDVVLVEDSVSYTYQVTDSTTAIAYRDTSYYVTNSKKVRQKAINDNAIKQSAKQHYGFIAQEYGAVWEGNPNLKEINWQKIAIIEWYAIQELIKEVAELKSKYADLDARLKKLE